MRSMEREGKGNRSRRQAPALSSALDRTSRKNKSGAGANRSLRRIWNGGGSGSRRSVHVGRFVREQQGVRVGFPRRERLARDVGAFLLGRLVLVVAPRQQIIVFRRLFPLF